MVFSVLKSLAVAALLLPLATLPTYAQRVASTHSSQPSGPIGVGVDYEWLTLAQAQAGQPLSYLIRIHNEGTDTARSVTVHDTLATRYLNLASVQMIASSVNCSWQLSAAGVLTVSLPGINLPPASVDSTASYGFFSFRVNTRTTLVLGDTIPNRAHVSFGTTPSLMSNTVFTIVGSPQGVAQDAAARAYSLYPNPTTSSATVSAELAAAGPVQIAVLDPLGRVVCQQRVAVAAPGPFQATLDVADVPAGLYSVQLRLHDGSAVTKQLQVSR